MPLSASLARIYQPLLQCYSCARLPPKCRRSSAWISAPSVSRSALLMRLPSATLNSLVQDGAAIIHVFHTMAYPMLYPAVYTSLVPHTQQSPEEISSLTHSCLAPLRSVRIALHMAPCWCLIHG
jgi:hypothetical protein